MGMCRESIAQPALEKKKGKWREGLAGVSWQKDGEG